VLLEKYADLFDFAPAGYFSLGENGRILEVNLNGAAMLGTERARLINRLLASFAVPAGRAPLAAFLKKVFSGTGKQVCEAALRRADGTTFWASFQGISALAGDGRLKWCRLAVSDISTLKQAEAILRRNEALFTALIQQAPVGVYVVDDRMRLQQVNPQAQASFQKFQPLVGQNFYEILRALWSGRIAHEIIERFRDTLQSGQPYASPEFRARRRDSGKTEFYEWQIQRVTLPSGEHGVVCFFTNITGRKESEEARRRLDILAASNRKLEAEILHREGVEKSLKQTEQHQRELLAQSQDMQKQLRQLSHQILSAQEEERKKISRELHDEIAQTLAGINTLLNTLKTEVGRHDRAFQDRIAHTQRLVKQSVDIVHRFARDLRPAVLDDLGLIPALHGFTKIFNEQTGLRVRITVFAGVEKLGNATRTVLYRVAQEALTNVARHARARATCA
jgi:PAS domain S-box-containing protein